MTGVFTAEEMVAATGGRMTVPFHAAGVSIDTRTIAPGELFVALKSGSGDGHAFLREALKRGAAGVLVHASDALPDGAPALLVHDTADALTALGAHARTRFEGEVVAVTGSVGKTTVKEMLRAALGANGPTHAAAASHNNHWGVPLTLARTPPDYAYSVVEIGMNHAGEIAPLARLAAPSVAVITAIGTAHIGQLGSIEAIADEKAAIAEGLVPGGVAILPEDTPLYDRLRARMPGGIEVRRFGAEDLRAIETGPDGSAVRAVVAGEEVSFRLRVPGRHMVLNALAALNACAALGADLGLACAALEDFAAVSGRGVRRALLGGEASLLDESYNASPASVAAALEILRVAPGARRVAVLGDMLELGEHATAEHAGLAPAVAGAADLLFTCGEHMRALFDAVPERLRGLHLPDSASLAPVVCEAVRPGDTVLVKGSNGSRMGVIVSALVEAG